MESFNRATGNLSTYEVGERVALDAETVRRFRNDAWRRLTAETRRKVVAYLTRRGLMPRETRTLRRQPVCRTPKPKS